MNKKILLIILVAALAIWVSSSRKTSTDWNFVGYQYRWDRNYVENIGLNSELECLQYGEIWIKKQTSDEALYTCSSGCKKDAVAPASISVRKFASTKGLDLLDVGNDVRKRAILVFVAYNLRIF